MKTLKTITIAMLMTALLAVSFVSKANTDDANPKISSLADQISTLLKYPDTAREEKIEGAVTFTFKIDESNKIHIEQISGSDNILIEFVKKALEGTEVKASEEKKNKLFLLPVIFRLI